jgi:hypothetical protein
MAADKMLTPIDSVKIDRVEPGATTSRGLRIRAL